MNNLHAVKPVRVIEATVGKQGLNGFVLEHIELERWPSCWGCPGYSVVFFEKAEAEIHVQEINEEFGLDETIDVFKQARFLLDGNIIHTYAVQAGWLPARENE